MPLRSWQIRQERRWILRRRSCLLTRRYRSKCAPALDQDVGGTGSFMLGGVGLVLVRRLKKATTIGIAIRMMARQSNPTPSIGGSWVELLTPFSSVLTGAPNATAAPKAHSN